MDVLTFLQPENSVSGNRSRPIPQSRSSLALSLQAEELSLPSYSKRASVSFSDLLSVPAPFSFPVMFLFFCVLLLAVTPIAQTQLGYYRLGRLSFPSYSSAETAMRVLVSPEKDAAGRYTDSEIDLPASIQAVQYDTYSVKNGDTVSGIMARFGLRNTGTLLSVNNIDNARRIRSGQILKIPSMDGVIYTVTSGDSLAGIASKYGLAVTGILDANDLVSSSLFPGQSLFIPGGALSTLELRKAMGELFVYPLRGRLTSSFGYRKDPFTGARTFHTGIDLAAPTGTPIKATLDGKVAVSGYSTVYGNYVIISHDGGYQSLYGHMSSIGVKRGQSITQGATIGRVGNTGYSTGSHLHFSVYRNGKMLDPQSVLK